ncbi:MAG: cob(I)yrinic acid a,c-diamide adenosyltransferase [candidate division Zixibacteria bacterium]|nr:cob(I)yrinic acid a,c-diamide adenosyltransferase [candidate division Zixibacteria bacterium]
MKKRKKTNQEQKLVVVLCGEGKGKTTSALGMALRAAGHGKKILMVQFIKDFSEYGEIKFSRKYPKGIEIHSMGRGYVGIFGDKLPFTGHKKAAKKALEFARKKGTSGKYFMVILDEINVALKLKLLKTDEVLKTLKRLKNKVNVVLTGRDAPGKLIKFADLVTEMREIKHPFRKGILAQEGIEY